MFQSKFVPVHKNTLSHTEKRNFRCHKEHLMGKDHHTMLIKCDYECYRERDWRNHNRQGKCYDYNVNRFRCMVDQKMTEPDSIYNIYIKPSYTGWCCGDGTTTIAETSNTFLQHDAVSLKLNAQDSDGTLKEMAVEMGVPWSIIDYSTSTAKKIQILHAIHASSMPNLVQALKKVCYTF